ncbi:MAG: FISUMP domain-containing protein [Cyclobacteriaceae bacterium]
MKGFMPIYFAGFISTALLSCATRLTTDTGNGQLKDQDGNMYTLHVMRDSRQWLTQNLNLNIPGSYCYSDSAENCLKYGRLYTWESARKGCETLGKYWRLPTNDEWEQMTQHYGGIRTDTGQDGKEAYKRLIQGGDSEFNILFGGTRDPSGGYRRSEAHGFFWTATESNSANAWFYNFGKGGQFVNRLNDGEKSRAISVRCINR